MPWLPASPGELPTLGFLALDWMTEYLCRPEVQEYEPFIATQEQADFLIEFYLLHPVTGARIRRRGVVSRSRGWGKSPFTAAIAAFEALGPALCDGYDAAGQPVGMPWVAIRKPLVEIAAVSEDQVVTNTWGPLCDMLSRGPVMDAYPGLEPMGAFVNLPFGRIQKRTAEATSAKGAPAHFVVCDQTESWRPANGGRRLFNTLRNNVIKRGGHLIESPNAYIPGEGSVAESSMAAYLAIRSGKTRLDDGIYFDHREAPPDTDLRDGPSLLRGLAIAFGDSADIPHCLIHNPPCERSGWVDLEHIKASIWEPDADEQLSRSDWLNQITNASDAFLSQPEWAARVSTDTVVSHGDAITLGFDGSRGRAKGKPDATALIGCRVSDGHLFEIGVWEANDARDDWEAWEPPIVEIEAALTSTFRDYAVVGFYADPARDWRSHVNAWEARFSARCRLKSTVNHPFEYWMTGGRATVVERAVEAFEGAVRNGDLTHSGEFRLTQHVLNARRRILHQKLALGKEHDSSPNKIDAAVAAVLAWQARLDAVSKGFGQERKTAVIIRAR